MLERPSSQRKLVIIFVAGRGALRKRKCNFFGWYRMDCKYNVSGAHALRESFSGILTHLIDEMDQTYEKIDKEDLNKIYFENGKLLGVYERI